MQEYSVEQIRERLRDATNGNIQGWARAHGISTGYVCDVLSCRKLPGDKILDALGIKKTFINKEI